MADRDCGIRDLDLRDEGDEDVLVNNYQMPQGQGHDGVEKAEDYSYHATEDRSNYANPNNIQYQTLGQEEAIARMTGNIHLGGPQRIGIDQGYHRPQQVMRPLGPDRIMELTSEDFASSQGQDVTLHYSQQEEPINYQRQYQNTEQQQPTLGEHQQIYASQSQPSSSWPCVPSESQLGVDNVSNVQMRSPPTTRQPHRLQNTFGRSRLPFSRFLDCSYNYRYSYGQQDGPHSPYQQWQHHIPFPNQGFPSPTHGHMTEANYMTRMDTMGSSVAPQAHYGPSDFHSQPPDVLALPPQYSPYEEANSSYSTESMSSSSNSAYTPTRIPPEEIHERSPVAQNSQPFTGRGGHYSSLVYQNDHDQSTVMAKLIGSEVSTTSPSVQPTKPRSRKQATSTKTPRKKSEKQKKNSDHLVQNQNASISASANPALPSFQTIKNSSGNSALATDGMSNVTSNVNVGPGPLEMEPGKEIKSSAFGQGASKQQASRPRGPRKSKAKACSSTLTQPSLGLDVSNGENVPGTVIITHEASPPEFTPTQAKVKYQRKPKNSDSTNVLPKPRQRKGNDTNSPVRTVRTKKTVVPLISPDQVGEQMKNLVTFVQKIGVPDPKEEILIVSDPRLQLPQFRDRSCPHLEAAMRTQEISGLQSVDKQPPTLTPMIGTETAHSSESGSHEVDHCYYTSMEGIIEEENTESEESRQMTSKVSRKPIVVKKSLKVTPVVSPKDKIDKEVTPLSTPVRENSESPAGIKAKRLRQRPSHHQSPLQRGKGQPVENPTKLYENFPFVVDKSELKRTTLSDATIYRIHKDFEGESPLLQKFVPVSISGRAFHRASNSAEAFLNPEKMDASFHRKYQPVYVLKIVDTKETSYIQCLDIEFNQNILLAIKETEDLFPLFYLLYDFLFREVVYGTGYINKRISEDSESFDPDYKEAWEVIGSMCQSRVDALLEQLNLPEEISLPFLTFPIVMFNKLKRSESDKQNGNQLCFACSNVKSKPVYSMEFQGCPYSPTTFVKREEETVIDLKKIRLVCTNCKHLLNLLVKLKHQKWIVHLCMKDYITDLVCELDPGEKLNPIQTINSLLKDHQWILKAFVEFKILLAEADRYVKPQKQILNTY